MKTINIKGKEYVPVVERVKEFHKLFPDASITTEVIDCGSERISIKATIKIPEFKVGGLAPREERIFTGHSQAEWGKGMMGGVALEVAETSAIGRALGFANIGLLDGIASADEMRKVKTIKERASAKPGLKLNINILELEGTTTSLLKSLIASLNGWSTPPRDTLFGPFRSWE